ncbi:hypothetical protein GCM10025867_20460 [Frondihabitans sucicola]|uniref:Uncharacterized protein n=1 Tax=Frondihabitans sucicola TaxID=1268041 RepID=A0ABN6Y1H6_9MICO|nr:hypothetical protein GCM10025867_20460 [Frondihabitans sucicola]
MPGAAARAREVADPGVPESEQVVDRQAGSCLFVDGDAVGPGIPRSRPPATTVGTGVLRGPARASTTASVGSAATTRPSTRIARKASTGLPPRREFSCMSVTVT